GLGCFQSDASCPLTVRAVDRRDDGAQPHVPVEPALVAEVTADTSVDDAGRYRHPVKFLRLRDDIGPGSVPPLP
ncbi:hypothetical protein ABZ863_32075, partial [Saccharomonospora sp. NPDC046836]|uniref:hypothetical protein n=1 Tax=Saccharomonospora sp. NPDC046836 TaxID=3156921 RepID=UPI0033DDEBFB